MALPHKCCNRRELESLIGHLHHAVKVVWPSRTFLRCMIDLLCRFRKRDHLIRLNSEFHLNLLWWHQFSSQWHGVSFWSFPGLLPTADVELSSYAVGSLGYGPFLEGFWFTESWAPSQQQQASSNRCPRLGPLVVLKECVLSLRQQCCSPHREFKFPA